MAKKFKKKKRRSNPWVYYWSGMGVLAVAILGMVIYFATRSKPEQVAQAPESTAPKAAPRREVPRPEPTVPAPSAEESKPATPPVKSEPVNQAPTNDPDSTPPAKTETPPTKAETPEPAPESRPTPVIGIAEGNMIREIEGKDLQGKAFKISDYRGKVVLIDFWGFW